MTMTILAMLMAVFLATSPASAACQFKFCKNPMIDMSKPIAILDTRGVKRLEIYDPKVPTKNLRIRDARTLRVLGFIERRTGAITDTKRRKVGSVEALD